MDAWPQAGQRKRKERDKTCTIDFLFTSKVGQTFLSVRFGYCFEGQAGMPVLLLVAQRVNCILARRAQGRVESANAAADKSHQQ